MTYHRTNKRREKEGKRGSKHNKTKKVGGDISLAIMATFTACMSVLQFIYYITAINKNVQPTGPLVSPPPNLIISYKDVKHLAESYPEGSPSLIHEEDMKLLKKENPKGIKEAIEKKYLKKIKRKTTADTTVEGYTLSAKGKKLITDNISRLSQ